MKILIYGFTCLGLGVLLGFFIFRTYSRPEIIINNHQEESALTDWEVMKLAIMKTESGFDELAIGRAGDWGLFQITPIYVEEVNRILGRERYGHEDAFNPEKSVAMFDIMQDHHNPEKNIDKAIASHNPTASGAYSVKVRKNMRLIKKYEELRKIIKTDIL